MDEQERSICQSIYVVLVKHGDVKAINKLAEARSVDMNNMMHAVVMKERSSYLVAMNRFKNGNAVGGKDDTDQH